jgi:hypothetical protein
MPRVLNQPIENKIIETFLGKHIEEPAAPWTTRSMAPTRHWDGIRQAECQARREKQSCMDDFT